MTKQMGDIKLVGTIDDITFYKMEGIGYARKKTSLTGKRMKRNPRFNRTMQSAYRLGWGSQLASNVYRSLPRTEQVYTLFKELPYSYPGYQGRKERGGGAVETPVPSG